jgi:threonine/homoserine/homoserine lactone efflux protein
MTSFTEAVLWLSVIFPLVFSAGPGNVLCAVAGASNGFRQSIPFILGLDCVYTSYALLAGFGMATIFETYPQVFVPIQLLGAVYVAWLGFKFLKRRSIKTSQTVTKLSFYDGVISQALNVKGVAIILTMYSQFIDTDQPLAGEVISLSLALLLLNLLTHATWAYGGAWIARTFASDKAVRIQSLVFGVMLILVSVWLLLRSGII